MLKASPASKVHAKESWSHRMSNVRFQLLFFCSQPYPRTEIWLGKESTEISVSEEYWPCVCLSTWWEMVHKDSVKASHKSIRERHGGQNI